MKVRLHVGRCSMKVLSTSSYPVSIFMAGNSLEAENVCRDFCDEVGLCVTVTHAVYAYTGGRESGLIVGLINYPRFPSEPALIEARAIELGMKLREALGQESFTVQSPRTTIWYSWRAADLAQGIEAAPAAETPQAGSVHESPVAKGDAPNGGTRPTEGLMDNPQHSLDAVAFTPGPWEAQLAEDSFFQDINITRDDGLAVAVAVVNGNISRAEAHENARLMAAAPRLYAALEALLALDADAPDAAIAEAHAAIAQARGSDDTQP